MPNVVDGRANVLGFGIRVTIDDDDDDEPLSKRGIFVCFRSYVTNSERDRERERNKTKTQKLN